MNSAIQIFYVQTLDFDRRFGFAFNKSNHSG